MEENDIRKNCSHLIASHYNCSKDYETSSAVVFLTIYYCLTTSVGVMYVTPDPGVIQDLMVIYKSMEPYWSPSVLDRVAGPNFDALLLLRHLKFTHFDRCCRHATKIIYRHSKAETISKVTVQSLLLQNYFSPTKIHIL